jgi:hypothetical protein
MFSGSRARSLCLIAASKLCNWCVLFRRPNPLNTVHPAVAALHARALNYTTAYMPLNSVGGVILESCLGTHSLSVSVSLLTVFILFNFNYSTTLTQLHSPQSFKHPIYHIRNGWQRSQQSTCRQNLASCPSFCPSQKRACSWNHFSATMTY